MMSLTLPHLIVALCARAFLLSSQQLTTAHQNHSMINGMYQDKFFTFVWAMILCCSHVLKQQNDVHLAGDIGWWLLPVQY